MSRVGVEGGREVLNQAGEAGRSPTTLSASGCEEETALAGMGLSTIISQSISSEKEACYDPVLPPFYFSIFLYLLCHMTSCHLIGHLTLVT